MPRSHSAAARPHGAGNALLRRAENSTDGQLHSLGNPLWWANTCLTGLSPQVLTYPLEWVRTTAPFLMANGNPTASWVRPSHFTAVFSSQAPQNLFLNPSSQSTTHLGSPLPHGLWCQGTTGVPGLGTMLQCAGAQGGLPSARHRAAGSTKRSSSRLPGSNLPWPRFGWDLPTPLRLGGLTSIMTTSTSQDFINKWNYTTSDGNYNANRDTTKSEEFGYVKSSFHR